MTSVFLGARVEDSGSYICSIPGLEERKRVEFNVVCKLHTRVFNILIN